MFVCSSVYLWTPPPEKYNAGHAFWATFVFTICLFCKYFPLQNLFFIQTRTRLLLLGSIGHIGGGDGRRNALKTEDPHLNVSREAPADGHSHLLGTASRFRWEIVVHFFRFFHFDIEMHQRNVDFIIFYIKKKKKDIAHHESSSCRFSKLTHNVGGKEKIPWILFLEQEKSELSGGSSQLTQDDLDVPHSWKICS